MKKVELTSDSPESTAGVAARVADGLSPGDIVLVSGDVGTGKTTFVRAACAALGVRENVTSPSFTIARAYEGRVPVAHLDLFRLDSLDDEDPTLLADYLQAGTVAFVEWPRAAAPELDPERIALRVRLEHMGGDTRRLSLSGRERLVENAERARGLSV